MESIEFTLLKKEAESWKHLYEHASNRSSEWAGKCGELKTMLKLAEYRLEVARREYARLTGTYDPEYPNLSGWETVQAFDSNPKYTITISGTPKQKLNDDILDLFKQSSKDTQKPFK